MLCGNLKGKEGTDFEYWEISFSTVKQRIPVTLLAAFTPGSRKHWIHMELVINI